jgi:hypothetical protein
MPAAAAAALPKTWLDMLLIPATSTTEYTIAMSVCPT